MQTYVWLSFCDPDRQKGTRFLGVAVVESSDFVEAIRKAWAKGCNPGGCVEGYLIHLPSIPAEYLNRLLNRDECRKLDELLAASLRTIH